MTVKELKEILDNIDDEYEVCYYDIISGLYNIIIDIDDHEKMVLIDMTRRY